MPTYSVDPRIFELFPHFHRGVVIATGINNSSDDDIELRHLLNDVAQGVSVVPTDAETRRIAAWNDAYTSVGIDPRKFTPSIRFLYEQIRRGKPPRSISKVVDVMNVTSIRRMIPCGGDDLCAIAPGDIHLGVATGDEIFAALFKPHTVEHPDPGEIVYYTPQSKRVMCRRWTWRNADFSKITSETHTVAINIDVMSPPFERSTVHDVSAEVATLLQRYCGANTVTYELSSSAPAFQFEFACPSL